MAKIFRFLAEDGAATAVEYAVMIALILAVCLVAISSLGVATKDMWDQSNAELSSHGF